MTQGEDEGILEEQVVGRVRAWIRRVIDRDVSWERSPDPSLKITLLNPEWDDDGALCLRVVMEEESMLADLEGVRTVAARKTKEE